MHSFFFKYFFITTIDRDPRYFWLFVGWATRRNTSKKLMVVYEVWCHEMGEWEEELTGFHSSVEEIKKGEKGMMTPCLLKSTLLQQTSQGWEAEKVLGNFSYRYDETILHLGCDFMCVSVQFSSVVQLCLTLCDPMDCGTPGFPVHHQLLELAQTHIHRVSDAIQPDRKSVV